MKACIAMVLLVFCTQSAAGDALPVADDPVLEQRVVKLTSELRCLVCQNQSLADSHADLAIDLKNQVRDQMQAGRSDAEIRAYMVARYGDFVLYDPPFKATTLLLWGGPFALLVVGLLGLAAYMRGRRRRLSDVELTPVDHARAQALLQGTESEKP